MTYQEFKKHTIHAVSDRLGSDFKVTLQDIVKNNDTHLDGLTILSKHSNISPTIYLNYYYDQYLAGKSLSDIYEDILIVYRRNTPKKKIDISFFTDYQKVKERIIFKLVNYERNKAQLAEVPHVRYLDLAIVFNCLVSSVTEGYATILIYHHHLSFWNISIEELYALAMQNTPKLLSYHLEDMAEILSEILSNENVSFFKEDFHSMPMYVLSNMSRLHGSGCILYKNLLADIAKRLKSDLYILPSSVHEVLLIPAQKADSYEALSSMVRDVNTTQLSREEILSDHVYYYSRKTGKLTM